MNSQPIIELLKNGEFEAALLLIESLKAHVDTLTVAVNTMKAEVAGTGTAHASPNSPYGTIHSPARLDPMTQAPVEKLVGKYLLGDQLSSNDVEGDIESGSLAVGPTSEILLNYMPTKGNHAIPKVYVDNMFRPINKALLTLANSLNKKAIVAYYFNSGNSQFTLKESDFKSGSIEHKNYFLVDTNPIAQMTFLKQGVYLLMIYASGIVGSGSSDFLVVNLNGSEVGRANLSSGSGPLFFPLYINAEDELSWQSIGSISNISFGISFVRLGDQ